MFSETTLKIILALVIGLSIIIIGNSKPMALLLAIVMTGSALLTVAKPDRIQSSTVQHEQTAENDGNNNILCDCICNIQEPIQD